MELDCPWRRSTDGCGAKKLQRLLDGFEELRQERLKASELSQLLLEVSNEAFWEHMTGSQLRRGYETLQGHQLCLSEEQGVLVEQVLQRIRLRCPEVQEMEQFREELREMKAEAMKKREAQMG